MHDDDEQRAASADEAAQDGIFGAQRLIGWEEIMQHSTALSLWIVVEGRVFDMTAFIGSDHPGGEVRRARSSHSHPAEHRTAASQPVCGHCAQSGLSPPCRLLALGAQEIPLEYGGKDATDFWLDMHGHVKAEILEDLAAGQGDNTGLDTLPKVSPQNDQTITNGSQ